MSCGLVSRKLMGVNWPDNIGQIHWSETHQLSANQRRESMHNPFYSGNEMSGEDFCDRANDQCLLVDPLMRLWVERYMT